MSPISLSSLLLCLLLLLSTTHNSTPLQIHILPHSHIDQGWLQTISQYQASVFQILSSVTGQMRQNADRTFAWGEVLYFRRWYESQTPQMQQYVTHLIQEGRFEFVHGGWIENDHASVSYQGIIEQMTLGYEYLKARFGIIPRFGFDIDPFGHSSHVAHLYKQMGVEMLIINRVHWKIKQMMKSSRNLEFLWMSNKQLMMFTHVLHTHYAAPQGFDFENSGIPAIHQGNVAQRAQILVQQLRERAHSYRTSVVLVPWGDDFKFRDAARQYSNMDQLIQWINANVQDIRIQYSTISRYFEDMQREAHAQKVQFSVVSHDFFPYADNEDSYWTGHFTSLPNLKKDIRRGEAAVRTAERLFTTASVLRWDAVQKYYAQFGNMLHQMRESLAVLYHHDSITGTCRKHVATDYMGKAGRVLEQAQGMQSKVLGLLLDGDAALPANPLSNSPPPIPKSPFHSITQMPLEESTTPYRFVVVNPVAHPRHELVHFISKTPNVLITTAKEDQNLAVVVTPYVLNHERLAPDFESTLYDVYVVVQCAALAVREYHVHTDRIDAKSDSPASLTVYTNNPSSHNYFQKLTSAPREIQIENDKYLIKINPTSGAIASVTNKMTHDTHTFNSQFSQFNTRRSGSYIFRPERDAEGIHDNRVQHIVVLKHALFEEVVVLGSRIHQRVRLMKFNVKTAANRYIQQTVFIAPLSGDTELMSNYFINDGQSSLITYDGINFVKRNVRHDAPIAARYYPSPSGAIYRGKKSQLTVLTQHAMGVTVSAPQDSGAGHLGFMVHRRLMKDDGRGMSEGNNDDTSLVVNFLISYDSVQSVHEGKFLEFHRMSHGWNHPVVGFFGELQRKQALAASSTVAASHLTLLNTANPDMKHVELISLDQRSSSSNEVVVRLHNLHATKEVSVNLAQLFDTRLVRVVSVTETTLNLAYLLPRDTKVFETPFAHESKKTILDFRSSVQQEGSNVAQNTNEEGVFLSDAALEHANVGARKLHSLIDKNFVFKIRPAEVATFVLELESDGLGQGATVAAPVFIEEDTLEQEAAVDHVEDAQSVLMEEQDDNPLKEDTQYVEPRPPTLPQTQSTHKPITESDLYDDTADDTTAPIFDNADTADTAPQQKIGNSNLLDEEHDQVILDHTFDLYFILVVLCSTLCITILVYLLRKRLPWWLRRYFDESATASLEETMEMEGLKQV